MTVDQISVFVQNRSGQLGDVTAVLRKNSINIRAMSLADTSDFGVLRLMVDDTEKAAAALRAAGFTVGITPVLAVEVEDRPGGLAALLELLAQQAINVEYLYGYTQRQSHAATLIFRSDRMADTERLFMENGYTVLSPEMLG